jgi:hypothetical protein
MKKFALYFSLAVFTLIGFSCAKKDSAKVYRLDQFSRCVDQDGQVVGQTLCTNNGYTYSVNGQCVQTATGQVVATQLCQQSNGLYSCIQTQTGGVVPNQYCSTASNFTYSCIQTSTRQPVPNNYCQQGSMGGVVQQQCYGPYLYNGQIIQCGIQYNCSGNVLTSAQTNQQVQCL